MGNRPSNPADNPSSLDHLTTNPRYQNTLRDIYSNNASIPAFPGTFLASDFDELNASRRGPISMKKTTPIKSDFLFEKNSVSLVSAGSPNLFYVTFKFSCRANIEITVYFRARDLMDSEMKTEEISISDKYPPAQTFTFGPGKEQEIPPNKILLNVAAYSQEDLTAILDDQYPLIIQFESKIEGIDIPKSRLYTYYTFRLEGEEKCEAKLIKQKLEFKNKAYILDDIYGITNTEKTIDTTQDSKDCSICLVNKLNTVILPCKHICLCVDCAKNLRFRNNQRCPICRKIVETFLILKKTRRNYDQ